MIAMPLLMLLAGGLTVVTAVSLLMFLLMKRWRSAAHAVGIGLAIAVLCIVLFGLMKAVGMPHGGTGSALGLIVALCLWGAAVAGCCVWLVFAWRLAGPAPAPGPRPPERR